MIPKLIIIADEARQRHALSDVAQFCGFEILHCLASRQFGETHVEHQPDLWIIDVEDEDDLLEQIGFDQPFLIGIVEAPSFTDQLLYKRWKQVISRKLLKLLTNDIPILNHQAVSLFTKGFSAPNIVLPDVWRVVILAASMGGLEAVKAFLDKLPTDLPVTFLLVQHINPHMQIQLPRILGRHNHWGFEALEHSDIQLVQGKIYIVPATQQINFAADGKIQLQPEVWPGSYQPSITEVMRRASNVFRQQLLTIVFSGMGDDGSKSASHQVVCGGKIWSQTAESCTSASQPNAMRATGQVCFNGCPEELANQLINEYQQDGEKLS